MQITVTSSDDDRVIQLDVDTDETVENVKALIEVQLQIPIAKQQLLYNGSPLTSDSVKLSELSIKEHDLIMVSSSNAPASNANPPTLPQGVREGMSVYDIPRNASPETLIQIVEKNPNILQQLKHGNPDLKAALESKDVSKVRVVLMQQQMQAAAKKYQEEQETKELNSNPFSAEAQAKIAENIRLGNVQQNMEMAMEEMPESFGRVNMLYIPCEVNGTKVKAFVDSGAQSTIMSSNCAERCGIMRLVDTRYAGQAVGVGTAKIIGRVHMAALKIGNVFFNCSFTILDQQDVDFLFGLDMLKRHQCSIDLFKNSLTLHGPSGVEEVPFLPEHEIPQSNFKRGDSKEDVSVPSPASSSAVPASSSQEGLTADAAKVEQLMGLGFSEDNAKNALRACNGNVDMAAAFLFESSQH